MKRQAPSDRVEILTGHAEISERDRRRLVDMRRENGAVEIRLSVAVRPAGKNAWRPVRGATRIYRSHSAMNAEQLIVGGPVAGKQFSATAALLEFYEQQHSKGDTK
jgi:hypothetical protein